MIQSFEQAIKNISDKVPAEEMVKIDNFLSELWLLRARCNANMNFFQKALNDCKKALEKNKDKASVYFVKGAIYIQILDYKKAKKYIKIAAKKGCVEAKGFVAQNNW